MRLGYDERDSRDRLIEQSERGQQPRTAAVFHRVFRIQLDRTLVVLQRVVELHPRWSFAALYWYTMCELP